MVTISIIIPIYNVEAYLVKCIESVLSQSFTEYELILVDDGSTDNCYQLCDEYAIKDKRIKSVHKRNGGSSSARNAGIDIAQGDYVLFLDADDYWENTEVLTKLNERINRYQEDVILYSCRTLHTDGRIEQTRGNYDIQLFNRHNKCETLEYLVKNNKIPGAAWILATKRQLIESLSLRFPLGVTAEDYVWVITILKECKSIGAINGKWYVYVKRDDSITSTAKLSGLKGLSLAVEKSDRIVKSYPMLRRYKNRLIYYMIMLYGKLPQGEIQKGKMIVQQHLYRLPVLLQIFINIIGLRLTAKMIDELYRIIKYAKSNRNNSYL